jgi:tetratricopeptide (TPR) repeat protein
MYMHRMAFEAELKGQFERADYFWAIVHSEMKPLLADDSKWGRIVRSLSKDCSPGEMGDPEKARSIFISEVLLDIHIAFHNGEVHSESLVSRAFTHFKYILALLSSSGLTKDDIYELLAPGLDDHIRLYREAGDWPEAISACQLLLDYAPDPDPYEAVFADLYAEFALSNKDDDSALLWSIDCLEDIIKDSPHCLRAYQMIGQLYKVRAGNLTAAQQFGDALFAVNKALTFDAALIELQAFRDSLIDNIKDMKAMIDADPSTSPQLNTDEEYLASEAARQARHGYRLARAYHLWRSIGLTSPMDKSGEVELHLLETVEELNRGAATGETNLEDGWRNLAANDPLLAGLDAKAICSYVSQHGADVMPLQLPPVVTPVHDPPRLTVKQARKQSPPEPLAYWFFSRKDLRIKVQVMAVILLLLTSGVLGLIEWRARGSRDKAFLRMLQSADQQQQLGVIEAAEDFMAHLPPVGNDTRIQRVFEYYDQALVRWVVENRDQDKADMEEHLNRYKQMSQSIKQEDGNEKDN